MAEEHVRTTWQQEAAFFDRVAAEEPVAPINPMVIQRYGAPSPRKRFREEFRFRILKSLQGKQVLDVGCGNGRNAVLLAKLGAQVTGIDISPKSIELAERKAAASGVERSVQFICSPIEEADIPEHSYDLIWGDCILHHLLESLDEVLPRIMSWAKPGAMLLFSEPVNFNNTLRRLRFKIPVKTDATPDERPLEPAELELVKRFVPDLHVHFFSLLTRLDRFVLPGMNYERASLARRAVFNAMAFVDYAVLSLPVLRRLGGYAVFYGHAPGVSAPSRF